MRKIIKKINKIAVHVSAFVLILMMFMVVADILLRNVFTLFIPGVFGLTQLFLSVIVFMSVAYAQDHYEHVYIDILYEAFPRTGKWVFSLISSILFLGINIVLTYYVLQFAIAQIDRGEYVSTLRFPLWPVSMIGAFGMFLFCLSVIGDIVYVVKDRGVLTLESS